MQSLEFYKKLYLIRTAEEQIIKHYYNDEMKTPMHMSMGQEAIAVGVLSALPDSAHICMTYRTHALYLARTMDLDSFFLELFGKIGGTADGKAGSMHLLSPKNFVSCSTAIVGTNIPVAAGIAFANKAKMINDPVVVFFGDGAIDEGVFWETLNFVCLRKLNVLFVYEDNGFAVHSHKVERHAYFDILDIVSQFHCNTFYDASNDAEEIAGITHDATVLSGQNGFPSFLHLECYRYLEHVGINEDFDANYRPKEEYNQWLLRDPIRLKRKHVALALGEDRVLEVEKEIDERVLSSFLKAKESTSFPDRAALYDGVFS